MKMGLTNGQLLNVIIIPTAIFLLVLLVLATFICLKVTNKWERQENIKRKQESKMRRKVLEDTAQDVAKSKQDIHKDKEKRSFRERTLKKTCDNSIRSSRNHLINGSVNGSFLKNSNNNNNNNNTMNGIENNAYAYDDTSTPSNVALEHENNFHYHSPHDNIYSNTHGNTNEHKVEIHERRSVDDSSSNNSSTIINVKNERETVKEDVKDVSSCNQPFKTPDTGRSPSNHSSHSSTDTKERLALNHDELMKRSQKFLHEDIEKAERYNHLPPLNNPPSVDS